MKAVPSEITLLLWSDLFVVGRKVSWKGGKVV